MLHEDELCKGKVTTQCLCDDSDIKDSDENSSDSDKGLQSSSFDMEEFKDMLVQMFLEGYEKLSKQEEEETEDDIDLDDLPDLDDELPDLDDMDDDDFDDDFWRRLFHDDDEDKEPLNPEEYQNIELDQIQGIEPIMTRVKQDILPVLTSAFKLEPPIPPVVGVMISGPRGSGKTHMALAMANHLSTAVSPLEIEIYLLKMDENDEDMDGDGDLRRLAKKLVDSETPAILIMDGISSKPVFNPDTMSMQADQSGGKTRYLNDLVKQRKAPLVLIGTTRELSQLSQAFFSPSLFALVVELDYPRVNVVWNRIMELAGITGPPLPEGLKVSVEDVKHVLKFAVINAQRRGENELKNEDLDYALSIIKNRNQNFNLPVEVPTETLADFVGDETVKKVKEQVLLSIKYSDLAEKYGITPARGVFITGPMGCGKTHLARCIAGELKWSLVHLNVGSFGSEYLHAHERQLHMMVNQWLTHKEPMVVLMDEVDNLVPLEAAKEDWAARTGNMVLLEIERLLHRTGAPVLVVAATSRPEDVNPALIRSGRLDIRIDLSFPNEKEREKLFRLYLGEMGKGLDLSAAIKQPYTPAEIQRVAKRTLWHAFVRATQTGDQTPPIQLDLQTAMKQIPPMDKLLHNRGSVSR